MATPQAGWYSDPSGVPGRIRYFDGAAWTGQVRDLPATAQFTPTAAAAPDPGHVAPNTAQALLVDTLRTWRPKWRPTSADAGWYPDPGRSLKLRFYDGIGWTARTRLPIDGAGRKLPQAAIALRARLLELADDRASKSDAGHRWRRQHATILRAQTMPSLRLASRTRSGRVGGMLSMAAVIAGVFMLLFAGWQQYGATMWQDRAQDQLRAELHDAFARTGGDYNDAFVADTSNPSPVPIPAVADPQPDRGPRPDRRPDRPAPTGPLALNSRPADIAPWPPAGWTPPPGRRARSVHEFRTGDVIGRLLIPRLGLDEVIVAGVGMNELAKGPGAAYFGVLPGSPGNAVIAGHRTGWGEPFRHLDQLRYGDQIIVEVPGQQRSVYEVRGRSIITPDETEVAEQTDGVRLTLTTCHPVSVNTHRMIVQAEMVQGPWLDQAVNRSDFRTLGNPG